MNFLTNNFEALRSKILINSLGSIGGILGKGFHFLDAHDFFLQQIFLFIDS